MSISNIDYSLANLTERSNGEKLNEPGIYQAVIEQAISKPNKAATGTNLAVYFQITAPEEKAGQTHAVYYAYEHPNGAVAARAILEIKTLLTDLGLPLGAKEQDLVGKKCHIEVALDKDNYLRLKRVKLIAPVKEANKPIQSFQSKVNPFDGTIPF
ncbi:MAG: hypothetical protein KA413_00195 [Candidatus Methylopumilus sp.]|nr:hypothetical protein [Candidatus Methylopumilus sp.]